MTLYERMPPGDLESLLKRKIEAFNEERAKKWLEIIPTGDLSVKNENKRAAIACIAELNRILIAFRGLETELECLRKAKKEGKEAIPNSNGR